MDNRSIIIFALTGLVAGYLASFIVGPSGWGLLGYLVSGVIGAFVGGWLLKTAGINLGIKNEVASLIATSTIGAIVVVIVARLIA
ncbi:MAG: GlsB/YeaQ/YmgE family stress response membrane protein [Hyphomicrobiaceae bacterium]